MRITDILWKESFAAKLAHKHGVTTLEAEEALRSKPLIRKIAKGRVCGEATLQPFEVPASTELVSVGR